MSSGVYGSEPEGGGRMSAEGLQVFFVETEGMAGI